MFSERDKARFWIKVKQLSMCWEWTGAVNNSGYGVFRLKGCSLAHRIAYQIMNGPISENLCVCHRCDNPKCVNPDHLFCTDHLGNMVDKMKKGRSRNFGRSSQYYGVSWRNDSKCWRSYVTVNKKFVHLSCHQDEKEAAIKHDVEEFRLYGKEGKLNFPSNWMPLSESPPDAL